MATLFNYPHLPYYKVINCVALLMIGEQLPPQFVNDRLDLETPGTRLTAKLILVFTLMLNLRIAAALWFALLHSLIPLQRKAVG